MKLKKVLIKKLKINALNKILLKKLSLIREIRPIYQKVHFTTKKVKY